MMNQLNSEFSITRPAVSQAQQFLIETLSGLEYRRIWNRDDMEEVGRLRQRAFDSCDLYIEKFGSSVIEDVDMDPRTCVFGVYDGPRLISTVRLNVVDANYRNSTATRIFGNVLNPLIDQGMRFIDPSRLAVDRDVSEDYPGLPLLTLRLAVLATIRFEANQCLSVIKDKHEAFYRRAFYSTRLAGPTTPDGINWRLYLMGALRTDWDRISARNPVFRYMQREMDQLFAPVGDGALPALSVLPTAAEANGLLPSQKSAVA